MHIRENLRAIEDRIRRACDAAGRDRSSVQLVAVSKTFSIDHIKAAYDLGLRHFGESRLQEALPKIEQLPEDITWHFVGKLQSNKAKRIAQNFQVIHSLENRSQLQEIAKGACRVEGLVEVNIAEEAQKSGVLPVEVAGFWKEALQCDCVQLRGLMTIGPANLNGEELRQLFITMRRLLESIGGEWLSMGMSANFEVAVQEGSTHIRVGTALFGTRTICN